MSKADEYAALRAEGLTYQEIAARCGCSRQNVSQTLSKQNLSQFRTLSKDRVHYDGLRDWLNENRVSVPELIRRLYGRNHRGYVMLRVRSILRGEVELKQTEIDSFRNMTGLTYEQLFCNREEDGHV